MGPGQGLGHVHERVGCSEGVVKGVAEVYRHLRAGKELACVSQEGGFGLAETCEEKHHFSGFG